MKEPYGEGVATHVDPELCGSVREGRDEALTGARASRVLSRESLETSECRRRAPWRKATWEASLPRDALRTPRGLRPCACTETPHPEPGRSCDRPRHDGPEVRGTNLQEHGTDVRT